MALADRIGTTTAKKPNGMPCSVGALLDALDGPELDAFNAMMYQLGWSQERIWEALKGEGHVVGKQTINRHRSQGCRCFQ